MPSVNFWPILVAALAAFGLSALWYSPLLFGKEWTASHGFDEKTIASIKERGVWKLYIIQLIASIIMFIVVAFLNSATGGASASDGAFLGFLVWLGFSATQSAGELLWKSTPFKLILIESVGILVNLLVGGAIIGAWQ